MAAMKAADFSCISSIVTEVLPQLDIKSLVSSQNGCLLIFCFWVSESLSGTPPRRLIICSSICCTICGFNRALQAFIQTLSSSQTNQRTPVDGVEVTMKTLGTSTQRISYPSTRSWIPYSAGASFSFPGSARESERFRNSSLTSRRSAARHVICVTSVITLFDILYLRFRISLDVRLMFNELFLSQVGPICPSQQQLQTNLLSRGGRGGVGGGTADASIRVYAEAAAAAEEEKCGGPSGDWRMPATLQADICFFAQKGTLLFLAIQHALSGTGGCCRCCCCAAPPIRQSKRRIVDGSWPTRQARARGRRGSERKERLLRRRL